MPCNRAVGKEGFVGRLRNRIARLPADAPTVRILPCAGAAPGEYNPLPPCSRRGKHVPPSADPRCVWLYAAASSAVTDPPTKRYIHPDETRIREAISKVWGGHSSGHSGENGDPKAAADSS